MTEDMRRECEEVCTSSCHADDCEHHGYLPDAARASRPVTATASLRVELVRLADELDRHADWRVEGGRVAVAAMQGVSGSLRTLAALPVREDEPTGIDVELAAHLTGIDEDELARLEGADRGRALPSHPHPSRTPRLLRPSARDVVRSIGPTTKGAWRMTRYIACPECIGGIASHAPGCEAARQINAMYRASTGIDVERLYDVLLVVTRPQLFPGDKGADAWRRKTAESIVHEYDRLTREASHA